MGKGCVHCERGGGGSVTFRIEGAFDYAVVVELKRMAAEQETAPDACVIDLKQTTYINSSAFGGLLFLKQTFGLPDEAIRIVNASPPVRKMLEAVHFDQLFNVL